MLEQVSTHERIRDTTGFRGDSSSESSESESITFRFSRLLLGAVLDEFVRSNTFGREEEDEEEEEEVVA